MKFSIKNMNVTGEFPYVQVEDSDCEWVNFNEIINYFKDLNIQNDKARKIVKHEKFKGEDGIDYIFVKPPSGKNDKYTKGNVSYNKCKIFFSPDFLPNLGFEITKNDTSITVLYTGKIKRPKAPNCRKLKYSDINTTISESSDNNSSDLSDNEIDMYKQNIENILFLKSKIYEKITNNSGIFVIVGPILKNVLVKTNIVINDIDSLITYTKQNSSEDINKNIFVYFGISCSISSDLLKMSKFPIFENFQRDECIKFIEIKEQFLDVAFSKFKNELTKMNIYYDNNFQSFINRKKYDKVIDALNDVKNDIKFEEFVYTFSNMKELIEDIKYSLSDIKDKLAKPTNKNICDSKSCTVY